MTQIEDLPQEILEYILYLVSPYDDLKSCRLVCHRWLESCLRVVKKRKNTFSSALKSGNINWYSPAIPSHVIPITQRHSHSACIEESSMYVFGGCTATNTTFNDLWRLDLGTHEWSRLLTIGTYPSPKAYASMVTWNKQLVLFGGWTHPSLYPLHQQWVLFNELHIYDILSNKWLQLNYPNSPPPTAGHSATTHGDVIIMFGGLQKNSGISSSTNNIFCLDIPGQTWFVPLVSNTKPEPRYGHSQIKIDEKHVIIIAGCGGSNKLYNDVWLLAMPDNLYNPSLEWKWEKILVCNPEYMPLQMWYNPACKVGDCVTILSAINPKRLTSALGTTHGSMSQLLVPGHVRRQSSNIWVPPALPRQQAPAEGWVHEPALPAPPQPDQNINGQRGKLRLPNTGSSGSESDDSSVVSRHRAKPSIRPNASCDRERRLLNLNRMEERIRTLSKANENSACKKSKNNSSSESMSFPIKSNVVVPHLLDISQVLLDKKATWLPTPATNNDYHYTGDLPQPSWLCSLLMGRGHLVMFGGIPNDPRLAQGLEPVSNKVTLLSASTLYSHTL